MKPKGDFDSVALVSLLEEMLVLSVTSSIDSKINNSRKITNLFFNIISHLDIDVEDLYKRYVIKNQLNIFRQKNGYKNGTYVKLWDGIEDNIVAFKIMDKNPNITPADLYNELEIKYSSLS